MKKGAWKKKYVHCMDHILSNGLHNKIKQTIKFHGHRYDEQEKKRKK